MSHLHLYRFFAMVALAAMLGVATPQASAAPAPQPAARPTAADPPSALVGSGVSDFAFAGQRLTWLTIPSCAGAPPHVAPRAAPQAAEDPVAMFRIPTYGGTTRQVFSRNDPRAPGACNPYLPRTNLVADRDAVYWMDSTGLVRMSNDANPGDPLPLLNPDLGGSNSGALAIGDSQIFVLIVVPASMVFPHGFISISVVEKATGAIGAQLVDAGTAVERASFDGTYLYYMVNGDLRRWRPGEGASVSLSTGVRAYYAEGGRTRCNGLECRLTNRVYVARSNTVTIYDNLTNTLASSAFYTSPNADATIFALTSDGANLFTFEQRSFCNPPMPNCFPNYFSDTLYRVPISAPSPAIIYTITQPSSMTPPIIHQLTTDGVFLYWDQDGALLKLANEVEAIPLASMGITGVEVTQGIQSSANTIRLIQNRRTFVRVYAQASGQAVRGVTMYLYASWAGGEGGPLLPANSAGKLLTIPIAPDRDNINSSFLFELPWEWTTKSDLRLRAVLNPFRSPPQTSYANNEMSAGPFSFQPSPRLDVQFVSFGYALNGRFYYPRMADDVLQTYSYIRRTYPLASTPGSYGDTSPGLRPNLWIVPDDNLGSRVNRSHSSCKDNLCAAIYTNSQLQAMRVEEQLPASLFMYGMISDAAGFFPRGLDSGGGNTSSGPVGVPGGVLSMEPSPAPGIRMFSPGRWDTDTSYGDWYAAHEIGHSLGRPHPSSGSDDPATADSFELCGHSRSGDLSYEHGDYDTPRAPIGPSNGSVAGFDVGDPVFGVSPAVLPSSQWNDFMSYCSNQWVSDYTYNALYDSMRAPRQAAARAAPRVRAEGDWLSVFGSIAPGGAASIAHLRRVSSVMEVPPRTPGAYSIRLLGAGGAALADYPFSLTEDEDAPVWSFGQVVPFVAGTRQVQIVRGADGAVLASALVSASAPVISDVALIDAPSPVDGVVRLGWTASDADGDDLRFDILYSRDGGATFQPVRLGVAGMSAEIDTARLGGSGQAILRVVASDGAQSAQADSQPFVMADKAPQPRILAPADGSHIQWGQLLNLMGEAEEFQDASASLTWSTQRGALGSGPLTTAERLPAGENVITLTATNSAGKSASTSVTVFVDDEVQLPDAQLTVGPAHIAWQVSAGETALQTASVDISNSGGGTLTWTATSDAPWLTLGASGGTGPATLGLSADPAMIPGAAARATITIMVQPNGNEAAQTATVAVSLTKGNDFTGPVVGPAPGAANPHIYLPLVQR